MLFVRGIVSQSYVATELLRILIRRCRCDKVVAIDVLADRCNYKALRGLFWCRLCQVLTCQCVVRGDSGGPGLLSVDIRCRMCSP